MTYADMRNNAMGFALTVEKDKNASVEAIVKSAEIIYAFLAEGNDK